jgi:peptidoglycan/xylan/chitin deacetylase (PgdA/CDA1 family)
MFHVLETNSQSAISFPPALFERGLAELARRGYRAMALTEVADVLRQRKPFPQRSLSVTFDDNHRSVYEIAFPVLQRHDMLDGTTVFLTVGSAPGPRQPDQTLPPLPGARRDQPTFSWRQVREMHAAGVRFGAHTAPHPDLTRLPAEQVEQEMARSRETIEDFLGAPATCFAYPYGRHDHQAVQLARKHFDCACSDRLGLVRGGKAGSDPYRLERVDAYYLRHDWSIGLLWSMWLAPYLQARNVPRQLRRRVRARLAIRQRGCNKPG